MARVNYLFSAGHRHMLTDRYVTSRCTNGHLTDHVVTEKTGTKKKMQWLSFVGRYHKVLSALAWLLCGSLCESAISSKHRS